MELWACFCFLFFVYFSFSPQPPERTQMFVTSRLLEMGFSMRHIYWAMEAAGTALWIVSLICFSFLCFLFETFVLHRVLQPFCSI